MRRFAAVAMVVASSCGGDPPAPFCPGGQCVSQETRSYFDTWPVRPVDLVVVIDDSPSMAAKQATVVERLRRVVGDRAGRSRAPIDLEMRLISTTAAGAAAGLPGCGARRAPACPVPGRGVFRWNQLCGAGPNFEGPLDAAVACAARFDAEGCAIEQPLAALEAELARAPLRPEAYLVLAIVTDEDDCSFSTPPFPLDAAAAAGDTAELSGKCRDADAEGRLEPVSRYVELLRSLKSPGKVAVSLIAGACTGEGLDAIAAPRLQRFLASWETISSISLCAADWQGALSPLGESFGDTFPPCLPGPLVDRDPAQPGVQLDCAVSEQSSATGTARVIPSCSVGTLPCWTTSVREGCPSGLSLQIDRGGCIPPGGTFVSVACATTPH